MGKKERKKKYCIFTRFEVDDDTGMVISQEIYLERGNSSRVRTRGEHMVVWCYELGQIPRAKDINWITYYRCRRYRAMEAHFAEQALFNLNLIRFLPSNRNHCISEMYPSHSDMDMNSRLKLVFFVSIDNINSRMLLDYPKILSNFIELLLEIPWN